MRAAVEAMLAAPPPLPPDPPKHQIPLSQWPGTPLTRTILAHYADDREVERVFIENPASLWVITPHRIVERRVFLKR